MQELKDVSILRDISEDVLQKNEGGEQKEGRGIQEVGPTQEKDNKEKSCRKQWGGKAKAS